MATCQALQTRNHYHSIPLSRVRIVEDSRRDAPSGKKFGKNANHFRRQGSSRDRGWDAKKDALGSPNPPAESMFTGIHLLNREQVIPVKLQGQSPQGERTVGRQSRERLCIRPGRRRKGPKKRVVVIYFPSKAENWSSTDWARLEPAQ